MTRRHPSQTTAQPGDTLAAPVLPTAEPPNAAAADGEEGLQGRQTADDFPQLRHMPRVDPAQDRTNRLVEVLRAVINAMVCLGFLEDTLWRSLEAVLVIPM